MTQKKSRRRILQLTGGAALFGLAGCSSIADMGDDQYQADNTPADNQSQQTQTQTTTQESIDQSPDDGENNGESQAVTRKSEEIVQPAGAVLDAPVEDTDSTYAVMGSADASAKMTLYGNWKCPYTQEFAVGGFLDEIVREYVEPGDLQIEYRSLSYLGGEPFLGPDAPLSAQAGLAAWNEDPENYWTYFAYVFKNQPQERFDWGTVPQMKLFAEEAGISNVEAFTSALENDEYLSAVEATTEAAAEVNVATVPRIVFEDGTTVRPTVDPDETRSEIEAQIDA
ncbi:MULTISPECIES: thioredoxin domain-containing protein [unclassified Haladaptatus]|uniref:DsbA family protein n=1 Tax=unclassified Haladaptatus TaxID=2622732 RepID=UPI0023E7D8DA|nr:MULTISPECIES: thioredoxin domain-containing protein [unclassified Haladaptatus]